MKQYEKEQFIKELTSSVEKAAKQRRYNAGMDGAHHDGGANKISNDLAMFLDGYNFALTGETSKYNQALSDFRTKKRLQDLEDDPEFQQYKELKKKFGDLDDSL